MTQNISAQLAQFVEGVAFDALPSDVIAESKRILLDSIGCAIAGVSLAKGRIAIDYSQVIGEGQNAATIFGSDRRSSIFGAAFANGELINALDFDAILPPGHVSPYVLPGALAIAEADHATGPELIVATAIAHEMANRFGKAMDSIRDVVDGVYMMPAVLGYTSTIFGATAAVTKLRGASAYVTEQALAIAAATAPVNSHRSWLEHTPVSTIKYTMAGPIVHGALTAGFMAMLGHIGDPAVFDDAEFGYRRFIGSARWEPARMLAGLGETWHFQRENSFKVYPHCRALHGLLDLLVQLLDENQIKAAEIDAIRAWGEGHVERACWTTSEIHDPVAGQFSMAHGLAVGAQRLPNSKVWQSPEVAYSPEVLGLMGKVTYEVHPDWAPAMVSDPAARPSRVEVDAHGRTFVATLRYPKGTAGDQSMTDAELADKFRLNTEGALAPAAIERAIESIMALEAADDVAPILRSLGG